MFSNHCGQFTMIFYQVATEVTSNLLSLAWRLRLDHIVGSNTPKPNPIYASLRLAFHPKCALFARKCIAQYRLNFQIIHCQFFFWMRPCWRLSNHKICIETGRYNDPSIPREYRKCVICNILEDEHHFMFICPTFNNIRMRFADILNK